MSDQMDAPQGPPNEEPVPETGSPSAPEQSAENPTEQPPAKAKAPRKRGPAKTSQPSGSNPENNLPNSRVQKIIKADFDIGPCQKEAVYLISAATEYFVQKLSEAAYSHSRLATRSTIQYRDLASAIKSTSDFHWLQDVVPTPEPLSVALAKRKEKLDERGNVPILPTFEPAHGASTSSSTKASKNALASSTGSQGKAEPESTEAGNADPVTAEFGNGESVEKPNVPQAEDVPMDTSNAPDFIDTNSAAEQPPM